MHIAITRDRAELTPQEIQDVLKVHIEKETGRKCDSAVYFNSNGEGYVHLKHVGQENE